MRSLRGIGLLVGLLSAQPLAAAVEISSLVICTGVDSKRNPLKITDTLPAATTEVFGCFSWKDATPGTTLLARWHYASEAFHILDFPIQLPRVSDQGAVSLRMPEGKSLPFGAYRLEIHASDQLLKTAPFTVLPEDSQSQAALQDSE